MSYYSIVQDMEVDIDLLRKDYEIVLNKLGFSTDNSKNKDFHAICVNRKPNDPNSISGGNIRGLYWTLPDETGKEEERLDPIDEEEYTEICPEFRGTYIEDVYNKISEKYKLGRVRLLMKPPRSCLSWHRDPDKRLHIPIITNPGARMVIEEESFHMPANGKLYITDNTKYHNFFNGGEQNRIHLVAVLINN